MAASRNAARARPRWSAWLAATAFAFGVSFIACSGDGPTAPPEFDLARSTLTVAPGPYVAGQSYVATFTARDGDGDLFTDALSITVGLSGGTSAGTFTPVSTTSPGVWTTTFSATTAGTASQVTLSVGGTPLTTGLPSITVVPGPASPVASSVGTSSANIQSGTSATITVTVRDALGNLRAAGGDVVTVGKGAGTSDGTLAPVTDQANGTYLSSFTGTVAGTPRTITAAIGGVAITSALPAITVTALPPSLATSTVTVGSATLASGAQTTLTLTARDAAGAAITTGGRVVQFTVGSGTSAGTISAVTDVGNGTYTATFTATTAGTPLSVSATVDGAPLTSVAPTITVFAGAVSLAQSTVSVSSASVVSGATATLTLTARDGAGNALTSGGLDVAFVLGTGTSAGTISAATDEGDGTYTAQFTATAAGTPREVGATIGGAAVTSVRPSITVVVGALSLAQSAVTAAATTLASGATTTLTLTARDGAGNAIPSGGETVAFTLGAGSAGGTLSATTDVGDGTYTATFTATTVGTPRAIGATVGGLALTSASPTIAVTPGAISTLTSTIASGAAALTSGTSTTLTLTAHDAAGNAIVTGGATVLFTLGAGTSGGTISATTDAGDGTYTANFTATTTGTARAIGATIGGEAVTSPGPTITVTPGALSLAQTSVTVGAATIAAGDATTITLTARDAAGNALGTGGETVAFTLGAGTSTGTIGPVTDVGDGTYTATFTAAGTGSARIVLATVNGDAVTSSPPTITVSAGAVSLSQSTVSVAAATVASGSTTTVTLTARDGLGNVLAGGGLSVTFSLGGGSSAGTFSAVTDGGNGTYTATFTATVAGTARTIEATIGGGAVTSTLPTITVTPGAVSLAQSTVSVSAASVASGASATLTLTSRDAAGNALTSGGLDVTFVLGSGTSAGTISAVTDQGDGTYTAQFTGTTAGTPRQVGATIGGATVTSARPSITVVAGALSLAQSTVTVGETTLASGAATTLTFTARDGTGNAITTGGETVVFTLGTGSAGGTLSATTDVGNGTYTAVFTATTVGTPRSIGATVGGLTLTSASPTIAVTPGAISTLTSTIASGSAALISGTSTTLTLTARDAAGNALVNGGATVLFTLGAGTSDGTISATTDVGDGTYTATFTATTIGTARAIGATIGGDAVTTPGPAITVTPGALSLAQTTVTVAAASIAAGDATTITLTARDAAGNALGTGGATVSFSLGAGTSAGTIGPVTDVGDGTYIATFTATGPGSARAVLASVNGDAITSTAPTITVSAGAVSLSQSTVSVAAATVASGGETTVTLTARDGLGNVLTGGGLTVAFTLGAGSSSGAFSTVTDVGDGTYTATFTATVAGTARTIEATIGGGAVTSALPAITVTPGAASLATSSVAVGVASLTSGSQTTLTLTARDAAGNALASGGLTVLFTKGTGTSDGDIGTVTDAGDGTYTALFTATTAGSARSIGATIDGAVVTSAPAAVTVTAGALSLTQTTVSLGATTLASGDTTTVTLTARDASGNVLPGGGLVVEFSLGAGTSAGAFGPVTDRGDGTYTTLLTATTVGSARSVLATVGGEPVASVAPAFTVIAGAVSLTQSSVSVSAATVASGSAVTLTLVTRDAAGNALSTGGLTVAFTKGSGTSDGDLSVATDVGDGTYTATFAATAAGDARAIGATIGGAPLTSAAPTITVTPGPVSIAQSSAAIRTSSLASGDTATITVTARDAFGNALGTGGAAVEVSLGGGTSAGDIGAVVDAADGTYRALFTATTAGTARTIVVTIDGDTLTSPAPSVTVTAGALSLAQSTVTVGSATLASGASTTLTFTARDASGNALGAGGATVAFTKGGGTSDGTIGPVTDVTDGTYTASFTATAAGSARAIGATVGGEAVTSTAPTIVVTPGTISPATSTIAASPTSIALGQSSTLTLTGRDAAGNLVTSGGATVVFTKVSGSADGPLSAATDVGDGTYTATFTAAIGGAPRVIGATIDGAAVSTTLPAITVSAPPAMFLSTKFVLIPVQQGTVSQPSVVTVANIGNGAIGGLATSDISWGSVGTCDSIDWLPNATFDQGGIADPVSLMSFQANAVGASLGDCTRRVIVTSTTPDVAPETLYVTMTVGRSATATGVVNVVMMGDASNNVVQTIAPTPVLTLDNGGRGTVTNLSATIVSQSGFAECVDPFDESTCVPWLAPADLVFSSPQLPSTLSIVSQVRPFSAAARVRVSGTGMTARDFDINVAFNVLPELVTNPRNSHTAIRLGSSIYEDEHLWSDTLIAFNQNSAHGALTNYRLDPAAPLPNWMSATIEPLSGNRARVILTTDVYNYFWQIRDTLIQSTVGWTYIDQSGITRNSTSGIRLIADCVNPDDCFDFGLGTTVPKAYEIPFTLKKEFGLTTPSTDLTVFTADTMPVTLDIPFFNEGAGEITGLVINGAPPAWISYAFIDGVTSTPTTIRATIDPRLLPDGPDVPFAYLTVQPTRVLEDGGVEYERHSLIVVIKVRRLQR